MIQATDFFKADNLLAGSLPPEKVEILYLFGRGKGDERGLFEHIGILFKQNIFEKVVLPNTKGERFGSNIPFEANLGKTFYTKKLKELGITSDNIIYSNPAYNANEECNSFIDYSRSQNNASAATITHPHQKLRIMLGLVNKMKRQNFFLKIYPLSPFYTNWQENVFVNQGLLKKTRLENINDEFDRILKYQKKDDLATLDELFAYLNKRDKSLLKK